MATASTNLHYWVNWRFLLCAIWIFSSMVFAAFLIWKYEGSRSDQDGSQTEECKGTLYEDDCWRPCLKEIHPAWLLVFRVTACCLLLALLIVNVGIDGGGILFYYTQWTFLLVTIYFGLGSCLSIYGCYQLLDKDGDYAVDHVRVDAEQGTYVAPTADGNVNSVRNFISPGFREERYVHQLAGFWVYVFQVIYQTNAGAVVLTDCVFWLVIVPFLALEDYKLSVINIGMHSVNAVFLLGDTVLNRLRFPWFRISYFLLWTAIYVIFQWIIHACVSLWWPYPFLDLSSSFAPLWYVAVGLMHLPCYAVFFLIIKMKYYLLLTWFPDSYQLSK
ncbi:hypothetical protein QJS10_CPB12g00159 [Acorus calamus]|uniref:Uncharacterized protein n=1 Tax=Acorus calamus TaxID=4465 RepID=A0AAV9DNP6_ACOCL|nr:hypothetical protein QJS10_CPB12g00159 [Acorus calamus]